MKQKTLKNTYAFEGKGLHTGRIAHMKIGPAPVNTGIRFCRVDIGNNAVVDAVASNVSSTARSTQISCGKASVRTIEHVLSALTGMGVDNAYIEIDSAEVPILDGSAKPYVEAIAKDGLVSQDEDRKWLELKEPVEVTNRKTGSYVRIVPADEMSFDSTIDFNSRVLGVQRAGWNLNEDYASQVAPCRTFCFFHEICLMASLGMVKGGDVENAIIIVEKPVSDRQISRMARIFKQPKLEVTPEGYFNNLHLNFPDECGRHKLLDLIGDMRLVGGFLKARVEAYKPGHALNTKAAEAVLKKII